MEFFNSVYVSDPAAIRSIVPEPLVSDGRTAWSTNGLTWPTSGFGPHHEPGIVLPRKLDDEPVNDTAMMFLNIEPPIVAGREIWGFPKRRGEPDLPVARDTLTGTPPYAGQRVAMGTWSTNTPRWAAMSQSSATELVKTNVTLKLIPDVNGSPRIGELAAFAMADVTVTCSPCRRTRRGSAGAPDR